MKKLMMLAVASVLSLGAYAANYVVVSNDDLVAGEEQIPGLAWYGWWNIATPTVDDAASPEGKAVKWEANDKTPGTCANFSGGVFFPGNDSFSLSSIAECDLVFYVRAEGTATWAVRLQSEGFCESDMPVNVPADGQYHEVRFNLPACYPAVSESWKTNNRGYVFAVVASNASEDAGLYVANVHYESAVPMPEITASVTDVTTTSAVLNYSVSFPEGYTATKVTINGKDASASPVALTGLTAHTQYTYTIVASGTYQGSEFSVEKAVTFTTARELGDVPVWYDSFDGTSTQYGNTYNIHIDYNITYNPDQTLTVYAEITGTDGIVGLANRQLSFVRGLVEEWTFMEAEGDGWIYTTKGTVADGTEVEFFFWLPYAEGVFGGNYHRTYVAGSSNEAPKTAPRIKAEARNVTYNSAEIAYEVVVPTSLAGADVTVYCNGQAVTANPVVLTDLTEKTQYSYELYAEAKLAGETYTSQTVTVEFKTPSATATEKVFNDYVKAEFKNAFLVGEDAAKARTHYMSLPFRLVYSVEGTLRYEIDLTQCANIVGLAPQIYWNGFKSLTQGENNVWSYDFGALDEGSNIVISHYLAYAGGVVDINFGALYPTVGLEKDAFELGEATSLTMSAAKTLVAVNEPVALVTVSKDADGYYLPADGVEYVVSDGAKVEDGKLVISLKQTVTVEAKCGALSATAEVTAGYSPEADNRTTGSTTISYATDEENLIEGTTAANAFDGNVNTELRWGCAETEEHYLHIDLGRDTYIETVDIIFEGAYATHYTVTLSNTDPGIAPAATRVAAKDDVVLNIENANSRFFTKVLDPAGSHRYVSIATTKALNAGWGIKIKEVSVYGTDNTPSTSTGVKNVAMPVDEGDTIDVYTTTGVRVMTATTRDEAVKTLAPGFYIMGRQKVIVR